jgi:TatD DNase family protein
MWFDSHCHLHHEEAPDAIFERALGAGVDAMVLIGTGASSSNKAVALADRLSSSARVYATAGQHPHDADSGSAEIVELVEQLSGAGRLSGRPGGVVAIGECGLDYHYDHSDRAAQRRAFAEQIELARRFDLAVVIHTREAWEDTFSVLSDTGVPERLIIHCFTGGPEEAARCLELGAYLSFSGIVTFKNAPEIREAAKLCPAERLLVETDAPWLAPVPHRGQPNEPAYVALVGEAVAALREVPAAELAATSSANARAVFKLEH